MQTTAVSSAQTPSSFVSRPRVAAPAAADVARNASSTDPSGTVDAAKSSSTGGQLSAQEQLLVAKLKETDRAVRAHEQAHLAAGAGLVRGGASFSFASGPDHQRYAVGGEVSIDTSPAASAQETIVKARQIRAAALAPADPSAQDLRVAARATGMESDARSELAVERRAVLAAQDRPTAAGAGREQGEAGVSFYHGVAQGLGSALGSGLNIYA